MNENIDLIKILKDCPKGTKFYSIIYGEVKFTTINKDDTYPIIFTTNHDSTVSVMSNGRHIELFDGECTLFPSKEQRDWSKFTAPWLKKERFDPKTLKAFDRLLVRKNNDYDWSCDFFSHLRNQKCYTITYSTFSQTIPYNDETKHLVGTTDKAPEYYRYWED